MISNKLKFSIITVLISIICIFPTKTIGKRNKIVIVKSRELTEYNLSLDGFHRGLTNAGVRYQSVIYCSDSSNIDTDKLITQISAEKPELIVTIGTKATKEISENISNIPIIYSMVLSPETQGFNNNQHEHNSNLSGVSLNISVDIQFEIIKSAFPDIKKIGVMHHNIHDSLLVEQAKISAKKLSLNLIPGKIKSEEDIPIVLKNLKLQSDILWILPNPHSISYHSLKYIIMFCNSRNYPFIGLSEHHVQAGAIIAFRADYYNIGKNTANLAIKVLNNNSIDNQKMLPPPEVKIFINKRSAKLKDIEINSSILEIADKIYE